MVATTSLPKPLETITFVRTSVQCPGDDEAKKCIAIINAADRALAAKDKELKLSDLALEQSKDAIDSLTKEVEDKDKKLGSIFRNPFVLIGIGLLGGAFLFRK